jgi:hypothetical protein
MTYPPPPGPDGTYPPPPDPPIQAYQPPPPNPQQYGYDYPAPQIQGYGVPPAPGYDYGNSGSPYSQQQGYPYAPARPTEGLAIASLVVSCAGVAGLCLWSIGGLLGIVGAILGHVARSRIRATGAGGAGLALAGIIVGWVVTAIAVLGIAVFVIFLVRDSGSTY